MSFQIDVKVIDSKEMLIEFSLLNNSTLAISDWLITMDFARYIYPQTLTAGTIKQIGTFSKMQPEAGLLTAPGEAYTVRFKVKSALYSNYECGIREAFITFADDQHQQKTKITVSRIELQLPEQQVVDKINEAPAELALIPAPVSVLDKQTSFALSSSTGVAFDLGSAKGAATWLIEELANRVELQAANQDAQIIFIEDMQLDQSAYCLDVTEQKVNISASTAAGFIYAVASLLQLIEQDATGHYSIKAVTIKDQARYHYRGVMLDCSRHFHGIATVKRLINQLARYKFNYFHWHLTDDEGWRLEIKAFPQLTQIGSVRGPGTALEPQFSHLQEQYGGFYTQQQVKEVIAYAQQRGITVIPEIDIPGHCRAAIKSLPELLFDPDDKSDYQSIQVYKDNILSPALPGTYEFIDKVLDEVCDLFPSPYVHIGADEVPEGVWTNSDKCQRLMEEQGYTDTKELQGHILRYAENKLKSRGKRMLGWEEVKHGDKVSKDTVVYSWVSEEAGLEAVKSGFDVVMQPSKYTYFDLKQDFVPEDVGVDWAGTLPLEQAYAYQPLSDIAADDPVRAHILGIQCALWCEVVLDQDRIDHMLFPRLLANAEVSWSQPEVRDWKGFKSRLQAQRVYLKEQGIKYREF